MSNISATAMVCRITCIVHHQLSPAIIAGLREVGIPSVMMENGRSIRYRRKRSRMRFKKQVIRTEDNPVDIFRIDVPRGQNTAVVQAVIGAGELDQPGRGTIFTQNVTEFVEMTVPGEPAIAGKRSPEAQVKSVDQLHNLALITAILSTGGERLSQLALGMGTGVPILTAGTGTGIRDRLGLLRITVPPEKELVHLLVPEHDAEGLLRQLIEEGRLNGPGKGFVYFTSVASGLLDTRLMIGPQIQAASMEQVVAAIDKLSAGTEWRKRFAAGDSADSFRFFREMNEITFVCDEERTKIFVNAALGEGASGATKSRVKRLMLSDSTVGNAARGRCVLTVAKKRTENILQAILAIGREHSEWLDSLQVLEAPAAYSYQGSRQKRAPLTGNN